MQVPALAHGHAAALPQIAEDARRDIEQRQASAPQFYRGAGATDEAAIAALRAVEPSDAQALAASVERARALRAAHDRIDACRTDPAYARRTTSRPTVQGRRSRP